MNRNEDKHLLLRAIDEVTQLRAANQILGAKVEVMELFGMALRARPEGYNSVSEDLVWRMQKRVEEIDAGQANPVNTHE